MMILRNKRLAPKGMIIVSISIFYATSIITKINLMGDILSVVSRMIYKAIPRAEPSTTVHAVYMVDDDVLRNERRNLLQHK